ncbi:phosphoglycerate kinase [Adlercreutzia sp. R21]|uniref:phosphoglycerate kinase n=1 Tax=Adlercreutzia wanghongyangiae TaxID=3111451 RepID=UPI002DB82AEA|nr:phosphoglycerate kinase [Adlercreutzia sp. R21]MEC4183204.1 phosphoglycerate kinase [Adlercreutzia sp. R21]
MADIKTIDDENFAGKKVLVRVDFNAPVDGEGNVTDDTRIRAALPTINKLIGDGAKVILTSHRGRPSGEGFEEAFSLGPIARRLQELIGRDIVLTRDLTGPAVSEVVDAMADGDVVLLENIRFDAREKKNDAAFARELADLADAYVNDAFGTAHRAHASTAGVAEFLPSYAGYLMEREVGTLTGMLDEPKRPFVAILGGSKVSDKIKVIDALLDKADTLIIGGGMCFTFLLAQGHAVGTSLKEEDWVDRAAAMIEKARERGVSLLLPVDVVVADAFANDAAIETVSVDAIPADMMGLDIGPATAELYAEAIGMAKSVFWNGPMGVFEMSSFEAGTRKVAEAVAANEAADTIIGGGDSVAAVNKFDLADAMTFISTGGGASMELVQGEQLPGVEALR